MKQRKYVLGSNSAPRLPSANCNIHHFPPRSVLIPRLPTAAGEKHPPGSRRPTSSTLKTFLCLTVSPLLTPRIPSSAMPSFGGRHKEKTADAMCMRV